MIRQIICRECRKTKRDLHPEDIAQGWNQREVFLSAVVPKGHGLTLNGAFSPLDDLHCDWCNAPLGGQIAVAVSQWNDNREGEPGNWEKDFGIVIPDPAMAVADALAKDKTV